MKGKRIQRWLLAGIGAAGLMSGLAGAQISDLPDGTIERCLTEGTIGKSVGTIFGVTRPVRLSVECAIDVDSAVFKSVDVHRRGLPPKVGGIREMHFSDSYKYERAAYLLDRELDLNLVPVAVIREVRGIEGALVSWIPDATHESMMTRPPTGRQLAELAESKAVMRLFDALILNTDRRQENWLVDSNTWALYLIDHSRAFRERKRLPDEFTDQRARLTRDLYTRLEKLNETGLQDLLGDLVSRSQIRSLLARRDQILEKIERDCEQWGCEAVFTDWQDGPSPIESIASGSLN